MIIGLVISPNSKRRLVILVLLEGLQHGFLWYVEHNRNVSCCLVSMLYKGGRVI